MLDAIQDRLGIVDHQNSELADLEVKTKPEDVLAEIARLHQRALKRIQLRQLAHFNRADPDFGCGVAAGLGLPMKEVEGLAKLPRTDLIKATALQDHD